jgi:undecaprenyl diphosphate synthase
MQNNLVRKLRHGQPKGGDCAGELSPAGDRATADLAAGMLSASNLSDAERATATFQSGKPAVGSHPASAPAAGERVDGVGSASLLHVGIIMDGNGRWATRRGLSRLHGHEAGVKAIQRIVRAAPGQGVGTLTLYAFSSDNWRRPPAEVAALMALLQFYLANEVAILIRNGVRLSLIGRRDRLPEGVAAAMARAEAATADGKTLHLRIAVDYSARVAILHAAAQAAGMGELTRENFSHLVTGEAGLRDVDLIIRTSGEQRLSDFLLWESAYAELHFTERMWPDFGADDLAVALASFRSRERRFGGLQPNAPDAALRQA